jgi:peptidoglycan hydrolase-like protein with peptidoglycan-binding domain
MNGHHRVNAMNQRAVISLLAAGLLSSGLAMAQARSDSMEQEAAKAQTITRHDLKPADVRRVQSALNEAGYNAGTVDGVWGAATTRALRDFQKGKGLEVTGALDEGSVLALGFSRDEFFQSAPQAALRPADIRQVQEALNKEGFRVSPVDGQWGPATRSALRDFQQARGLEPSGTLDRETVLALGLSVSDFAAGEFNREPRDR